MGLQDLAIARHQLQVAQNAGFALGAYTWWHPFWRTGQAAIDEALSRTEGFPVRFLGLDVEDPVMSWGWPRLVREMVDACLGANILPIIYTSSSMWAKLMGGTTDYAHLLLWDASYGDEPFRPYGGWTRRAIWQYQETTDLCGTSVDLDRVV